MTRDDLGRLVYEACGGPTTGPYRWQNLSEQARDRYCRMADAAVAVVRAKHEEAALHDASDVISLQARIAELEESARNNAACHEQHIADLGRRITGIETANNVRSASDAVTLAESWQRIAELEAALEPFAAVGRDIPAHWHGSNFFVTPAYTSPHHTVSQYRAAAMACARKGTPAMKSDLDRLQASGELIVVRRCSLCLEPLGYRFINDQWYFDGRCDCLSYKTPPRLVDADEVRNALNALKGIPS